VHVNAVGATIDLRSPQLDQMEDPEVGGSSPPNRTTLFSINSATYGMRGFPTLLFHVASCCNRLPLISKGFLRHSANPRDMDATWEGGIWRMRVLRL
jgi:hypothetical protein